MPLLVLLGKMFHVDYNYDSKFGRQKRSGRDEAIFT